MYHYIIGKHWIIGCVIHIGVGLRVARFYLQGNAKTSMCGAGDSARLHAFLCVYRILFQSAWKPAGIHNTIGMNIITQNPYRVIGVFANSKTKERVANINRIKAFIKVNKSIAFPLDLKTLLPEINRSLEDVNNAEANLTLPNDQVKYAQFWFINETPFDEIAFNNLFAGDITKALEIWSKKDNQSSLHNRIVVLLANKDFKEAISLAEKFYTEYGTAFIGSIADNSNLNSETIGFNFVDTLCDEFGLNHIMPHISNEDWKTHLSSQAITPIIEKLQSAVQTAKVSKGKAPKERYNAGVKLVNEAKKLLKNLRDFLSTTDLQYQMIADKVGLEVLQCGIDYYNGSDDDDAAHKAMPLQKYALSVVVGKMAKDRCNENVKILQKIIDELPPKEVMHEHKNIQTALEIFMQQPDLIANSIKLIKACVPYIVSIKEKLGSTHRYYLNISTIIVNNALGNVITEVNAAQGKDFNILKTVLINAWRTQLYIDKFDLEPQYKEGRYKESRNSLYNIIENCKGFESSSLSFMYQYGCGWCNNLDVSDIDLRTDDEYYASCTTRVSYKKYIEKFPNGKHVVEAKSQIESLTFQAAKTIDDYIKFINDYPNSILRPKAQKAIHKLKEEIETFNKELIACVTTNEVIGLYKTKKVLTDIHSTCSVRAFELAKNEEDYRQVLDTFGVSSTGGSKAKSELEHIEAKRQRIKKIGWIIFITFISLLILVAAYAIGKGVGLFIAIMILIKFFTQD